MNFNKYRDLQNLLLSIDDEKSVEQVRIFIEVYDLLSKKKISYTLKLIASFVYSRPKLFDKIIILLKKFRKFKINFFDNPQILISTLEYICTSKITVQRLKILFLLTFRSGHITEKMYDHLIEYHNQTYGFIYDGTIEFQSPNFKFFLRFDHNESLYYAILNDDLDLLQKIVVLNEIDIQQLYKFPHFEIYFQFKSSTLLEYAAFFGSIQCFKYLLVNSNNIDFKILLECSIAGGNYDIIHIVENQSHDISITQNVNLLYLAILYMRNDL